MLSSACFLKSSRFPNFTVNSLFGSNTDLGSSIHMTKPSSIFNLELLYKTFWGHWSRSLARLEGLSQKAVLLLQKASSQDALVLNLHCCYLEVLWDSLFQAEKFPSLYQ